MPDPIFPPYAPPQKQPIPPEWQEVKPRPPRPQALDPQHAQYYKDYIREFDERVRTDPEFAKMSHLHEVRGTRDGYEQLLNSYLPPAPMPGGSPQMMPSDHLRQTGQPLPLAPHTLGSAENFNLMPQGQPMQTPQQFYDPSQMQWQNRPTSLEQLLLGG